MATATVKQLSQKLNSIAESWIKDPFRPNLQLQTFLKSLAAHPRLTPQAVDAACALRDNQLQKQYPLSKRILRPATAPHHYERLVEGFDKSAQGIGRPWWKVFFGVW
ncbi:hypothetical protein BYT27DRAFT_7228840 [Phlegmacium glaucopus]|nr:hypothetical protein BYT27DRAFT_7228840 [Phlegmacium glaucopus]